MTGLFDFWGLKQLFIVEKPKGIMENLPFFKFLKMILQIIYAHTTKPTTLSKGQFVRDSNADNKNILTHNEGIETAHL